MTHNATDWVLTPRQAKVLDTAHEAGLSRNISAICRDAGVSRRSFYRWLDEADFAAAWDGVWRGSIRRHLPGAVAALVARALQGDVRAIRLMADLAGVLKVRQEVTGHSGGPLTFAAISEWAAEQEAEEEMAGPEVSQAEK